MTFNCSFCHDHGCQVCDVTELLLQESPTAWRHATEMRDAIRIEEESQGTQGTEGCWSC